MCKSDGEFCDPDARGVQLEAFGGLDDSGAARRTASRPAMA